MSCLISYVYGPIFLHVCLIEICLRRNLGWFVSGLSKRECFVCLICILRLHQHMYVCVLWRSRIFTPSLNDLNIYLILFFPGFFLALNFCSLRPMYGNMESRIREKFACANRNPELWNPEYSSKDPDSD